MKTSVHYNDGLTVPYAFVTVGRQRVKQYGNTVYLNNGNEFEIELFNPTNNKVLAKIELNGVPLGSGIVLRPAERVYLERYLNEARKFLFETYEVDKNNPSVQKAIANNGKVCVRFYNEYINYGITYSGWPSSWGYTRPFPTWESPTYTCHASSSFNANIPITGSIKTQGTEDNGINSVMFCSTNNAGISAPCVSNNVEFEMNMERSKSAHKHHLFSKSMETGRIDKGGVSSQSFTYDNTTFNTWYSWSSEWQILPMSQKAMVREDIKVFCPNCGMRQRKSSHKFCPNCGTRY